MEERKGEELPDYILSEWDHRLIAAAIGLGDTLIRLPEATEQNNQDIVRFQQILRRLPAVTPMVWASYSFSVSKLELDFEGVNREWCVILEKGALIEIASIYVTVPDRDVMEDSIHEDIFMFEPGWRRPDQDFEIETEHEPLPINSPRL